MPVLEVNGDSFHITSDCELPLLWALRDHLGLTGTKFGCGVGVCGICVVHVDGRPRRACVTPVHEVVGRSITTIEGLGADHPVARAWFAEQVPQCGYCQPGQIMTAAALLAEQPDPDAASVEAWMDPVLCRCGSYPRIRRAIHRAAHEADRLAPLPEPGDALPAGEPLAPNPWVCVYPDGSAQVLIDRAEMGQGVMGSLSRLVAEELELAPEQVHPVFAPTAPVYTNPLIGEQLTGGSTSVRGSWEPLRRAGAQARSLLIEAAAQRWRVSPGECRAQAGQVIHEPSGQRLGYGVLVDDARALPVPEDPPLKDPAAFRLIGRARPRPDTAQMITGRTLYGSDIALPGQRYAVVQRCPVPEGRPAEVSAEPAGDIPGVRAVLHIPTGIAVVASDLWSALRGRQALRVSWQEGPLAELSTASIRQQLAEAEAHGAPTPVATRGNTAAALADAAQTMDAVYETPYLAHGCLEPMNATAQVTDRRCDVWVGTQAHTATQATAAQITGLPLEAVHVHALHLGGGFGRRGDTDFVAEAVTIAQAMGEPVQVLWTRDDDLRHDTYRPANRNRIRAGLDETGQPVAWHQRTTGPDLSLDGNEVAYTIAHYHEEQVEADPGLPTGAWRSVGASQNAFAVESMIDELAYAANADPVDYRGRLLTHEPRLRYVLERAAEQARWGEPLPEGHGRGIACYPCFRSYVAEVTEVSVAADGSLRVHEMVGVIDCGQVVDPDTVAAQMEGGMIFGLSAALQEAITVSRGRVQEASFEDYPILTLAQTPTVRVHIVPSSEPPGGVGEPGVPPAAPALTNAVFAATGYRVRRLPLTHEGFGLAASS